jgi:hypothetical protein
MLRNVRALSSILLVSIWRNINVIKKKLKNCIHVIQKDIDVIFYYIYVIPDGHQKNTRRELWHFSIMLNAYIIRKIRLCLFWGKINFRKHFFYFLVLGAT